MFARGSSPKTSRQMTHRVELPPWLSGFSAGGSAPAAAETAAASGACTLSLLLLLLLLLLPILLPPSSCIPAAMGVDPRGVAGDGDTSAPTLTREVRRVNRRALLAGV